MIGSLDQNGIHTNMSLLHFDEARKTNIFSLYEHETFTNRLEHVISKTGLSQLKYTISVLLASINKI